MIKYGLVKVSENQTIGTEMVFDLPSLFYYKTHSQVKGMMLRKTNWRRIEVRRFSDEETQLTYSRITFKLKKKLLWFFLNHIYFKLQSFMY